MRISFLVVAALMSFSCAQKPTQTYVQKIPQKSSQSVLLTQIPVIAESTIVVDARSAFENSLAQVPGSIWLNSRDFFQKKEPFKGLLVKDMYSHARRLARMGISLEDTVIVLGNAQKGNAEEGELVWVLRYLGVKQVHFVGIDNYKLQSQAQKNPAKESKTIWKPQYSRLREIGMSEFRKLSKKQSSFKVLDVRKEREYLKSQGDPEVESLNIPWTEFILDSGLPNQKLSQSLNSLGIHKEMNIILISELGTEARLAQVVLEDLGYKNARVLAGGYQLLRSKVKN